MRAPASLADRIATALDDAGLRSRLGRAARDRAVARYALSDRLADHLALLRRVAGRHRSETNFDAIHDHVPTNRQ